MGFRERSKQGFKNFPAKHPILVTVEVMLTEQEIGEIYIKARERGITVEEYIANEVGYKAEQIQF